MLNDILVHIPADRPADGIVACAVSVAKIFDAHLDGIVCAYQPINPAIVVGASAAYYAAATQLNTDVDEAAARLDEFEIAARAAGVSHGARSICDTPVLANIRPAGDKYLMEDFYYAGGLPALSAGFAAGSAGLAGSGSSFVAFLNSLID